MTEAFRRKSELAEADLERLSVAHQRLRDAIADYERRFVTGRLAPGEDAAVADDVEMKAAMLEAQSAEQNLWRLREELLGWSRPPAFPSALQMTEWFSEEDSVYDDGPDVTAR